MGRSFQDYSQIQIFEADFPQKVSLKMLNLADYDSFSDLFSVYLLSNWSFKLEIVNILWDYWKFLDFNSKVEDFWYFKLLPMQLEGIDLEGKDLTLSYNQIHMSCHENPVLVEIGHQRCKPACASA